MSNTSSNVSSVKNKECTIKISFNKGNGSYLILGWSGISNTFQNSGVIKCYQNDIEIDLPTQYLGIIILRDLYKNSVDNCISSAYIVSTIDGANLEIEKLSIKN